MLLDRWASVPPARCAMHTPLMVLMGINTDDLEDMGIHLVGDRRWVLTALSEQP
jgi:hypothetical protein